MEKQNDLALAQAQQHSGARREHDPTRYAAPLRGLGLGARWRRRAVSSAATVIEVLEPRRPRSIPRNRSTCVGDRRRGALLRAPRPRQGSEAAYGKALRLDARNARAWYMLGKAYKDESKMGEAINALRNATSLAAHGTEWLPDAYQQLGYTYRQMGLRAASMLLRSVPALHRRSPRPIRRRSACSKSAGEAAIL